MVSTVQTTSGWKTAQVTCSTEAEQKFLDIYKRAVAAGKKAIENKPEEFYCGFAWVEIEGTTPFARWVKKNELAAKHYPKGYMFWIGEGGQSMNLKEDYANAFKAVLRENGIKAYMGSRAD